jgi:hypothetical protein
MAPLLLLIAIATAPDADAQAVGHATAVIVPGARIALAEQTAALQADTPAPQRSRIVRNEGEFRLVEFQ